MNNSTFFSGKQILVTGAKGFIGKKLCHRLKDIDANIYATSTKQQKESSEINKWFVGDLGNLEFTRSVVKESKPDIIFHLAGYTSGSRELKNVQPAFHNNLATTVNILTASADIEIERLVLAGSMEEPEINDEEPTPVSPYAASKWAGSSYARMFYKLYDTPITIPRIFMVYGPAPQDYENLIPYVIHCLLHQKKPKLTSGERLVDWIFIDDVVEGLLQIAKADGVEGKTIDLGSGKQLSIKEVCTSIKRIMGSNVEIEFGALPDRAFEKITVADLTMAREYLEWYPQVNINEGLEKTIDWFQKKVEKENF